MAEAQAIGSCGCEAVLTDEAERQVRDIVERLAKDPAAAGPGGQRIGDLYAAWMAETGIQRRPGDKLYLPPDKRVHLW